jgi:transposase-like protein
MTLVRQPQEKAMRQQQMTRLIHSLPQLTHHQRQQLASSLQALLDHSQSIAVVETHNCAPRACPHCSNSLLVKNGSANGLQRFKCRQCARTFNALTGTPLARLHLRDKWMGQAQALGEGLSLNQVAQRLGVAQSTAFRWRHRFLACPKSVQARQLVGIAEADESYFLASCKGHRGLLRRPRRRGGKALAGCKGSEYTPVLMARDRAGATANLILQTNMAVSVQAALKPLLAPDTILCTDGSITLASAARALGVQHQAVNVSRGNRVRGPWHVQNVNAYVSRLRGWMQRFKGVATKYLDSYLGWFRMLDRSGPMGPQPAQVLEAAMGNQGVTSTSFPQKLYVSAIWKSKLFHWKRTGWAFISSMPLRMRSLSSSSEATRMCRRNERAIFEKADSTRLSQEPCFGVCTYSKRPGRLAK